MNEVQLGLLALLPSKRKTTPSGWTSFNAPCCHHRGNRADDRQRGGVLINPNGGFQYHCFNCNFKAGWTPGHLLSRNTKDLFSWIGMSDTDISKLNLYALKIKDNQPVTTKQLSFVLEEKHLPDNCKSLNEWIKIDPNNPDMIAVLEYLINRGMKFEWYDWHWTDINGYKDRIIIPFYQDNKIVGYTGRKITNGKPKYLTDAQPGYVFNLSSQPANRKYIIIVEGQFDAIAIDGAAIMSNEINETQAARINALGKEVIVVPDRDKPGSKMIKKALEYGWSASLPDWGDNIKDVADAVKHFGRIYTLYNIIEHKESSSIKMQLLYKKLENINDET